jgi:alpha-N-arabinofuranosidase
VHIAFVNLDPVRRTTVRMNLGGVSFGSVQGQVLTSSKFNDYNSFEQPGRVAPALFNGAKKDGAEVVADLPPMSVVVLALKN